MSGLIENNIYAYAMYIIFYNNTLPVQERQSNLRSKKKIATIFASLESDKTA